MANLADVGEAGASDRQLEIAGTGWDTSGQGVVLTQAAPMASISGPIMEAATSIGLPPIDTLPREEQAAYWQDLVRRSATTILPNVHGVLTGLAVSAPASASAFEPIGGDLGLVNFNQGVWGGDPEGALGPVVLGGESSSELGSVTLGGFGGEVHW